MVQSRAYMDEARNTVTVIARRLPMFVSWLAGVGDVMPYQLLLRIGPGFSVMPQDYEE